ncbi:MAG: hypothetical protein ACR2RF_21180 [Geminicoccaceae bacterium]
MRNLRIQILPQTRPFLRTPLIERLQWEMIAGRNPMEGQNLSKLGLMGQSHLPDNRKRRYRQTGVSRKGVKLGAATGIGRRKKMMIINGMSQTQIVRNIISAIVHVVDLAAWNRLLIARPEKGQGFLLHQLRSHLRNSSTHISILDALKIGCRLINSRFAPPATKIQVLHLFKGLLLLGCRNLLVLQKGQDLVQLFLAVTVELGQRLFREVAIIPEEMAFERLKLSFLDSGVIERKMLFGLPAQGVQKTLILGLKRSKLVRVAKGNKRTI